MLSAANRSKPSTPLARSKVEVEEFGRFEIRDSRFEIRDLRFEI